MVTKRRSLEDGHRRKFLVVVDDTPECGRALLYAAKRAEHTNGALLMLYVIAPSDFQHWIGVENIMRAEAMEEAETVLARAAERVKASVNIDPEMAVREGMSAEVILELIEEDEDIAILVLAAGTESEGPGPLVTQVAYQSSGTFPVPITIVPGTLSDDDIAAIA
ncbi:MAG: universal stress protein [Stappiaceae bacterium]